ncbi:hypothetical protein F2P56_027208 [Juglans regia]|uniref:Uncharacterized protein n=1 Tax=Juglans regia TaxID=51240 RepID=A0A833TP75_JUGRE|nr:hypothetical protein F2P56_027208 [Juglans regia]
MFNELMGHTGMGCDGSTTSVIASDEYWANAIRVSNDNKYFRNADYPFCAKLCTTFGTPAPTGTSHSPASNQVEDVDGERHLDAGMQNPTTIFMRTSTSGPSTRKCYEGMAEAFSPKWSKRSAPKMGSDDSDSFADCVNLLLNIKPKMLVENWFCAYDALRESSLERYGFLTMDDESRELWAMRF